MFEVARWWRVSPNEVQALSLAEFEEWEAQAVRINELEKSDG